TDQTAGLPFAQFAVPGRDVGLQLVLQQDASGGGILLVLPYRGVVSSNGAASAVGLNPLALAQGEAGQVQGTDFSVQFADVSAYTLLIAKKDPGAYIAWAAFGLLIVGLLITFWLPRRRIWGRLDGGGHLALTVKADRYVDVGREFGRFLDDLVTARRQQGEA
ncbi:MAG TPA: cytochrome c biogenesis protein ResB, partial [Candidatus Limnocylindrales bacterium]